MKELKFNIQYLMKRKELYFSIIIILLINLIHVILCVNESLRLGNFIEGSYTSEYQFILYNAQISLNVLVIIAFPIVLSLVISDSSWLDKKNKTVNLLNTRLNYKKNILVRFFLSFIIAFIISFLGFLINYILLRMIYGSGNNLTYFQSLPFYLENNSLWFLDDLRLVNPTLFVLTINCTVSILLGLLSGLTYICSFFVNQRIIIYFIPLIFLILVELLFPLIGIDNISFISMLQPFSQFNMNSYVIGIIILLCVNILLLCISLRKKDVLIWKKFCFQKLSCYI